MKIRIIIMLALATVFAGCMVKDVSILNDTVKLGEFRFAIPSIYQVGAVEKSTDTDGSIQWSAALMDFRRENAGEANLSPPIPDEDVEPEGDGQ